MLIASTPLLVKMMLLHFKHEAARVKCAQNVNSRLAGAYSVTAFAF